MQSQITSMLPSHQDVYTDLNSLARLRHQAKENPEEGLKAVAQQFEALFMQMALKSMRDASFGNPLFDSDQGEFYQDMFDKQLTLNLSKGQGMGLADALERQLRGSIHSLQDKPDQSPESTIKVPDNSEQSEAVSKPSAFSMANYWNKNISTANDESVSKLDKPELKMPDLSVISISSKKTLDKPATTEVLPARFNDPVEFVTSLRPYAEKAAEKLGVSTDVLLAQAALETGWGKHINQHTDGSSSYNLFNIKANTGWDGDRVAINTLEYRGGIAQRERAAFRSYSSYADSFNDYVDFIRSRPRYQEALNQSYDAEAYIQELQNAGYATDPNYADKIINIMQRPLVQNSESFSTRDTSRDASNVG
ncbi:MAG: flagellar assembly peptidoglycan hydrolase FlgJ [Gammaproteobacteria bacterium]|nr:flagellar assembly peptidoglycan hydrolase FlgJ [Gammaproteobacteria bacterium]